MTDATIRADLDRILTAVANTGTIYDHQFWAMHWTDILAGLKVDISGTEQIRGWTITCEGWTDEAYQTEWSSQSETSAATVIRNYRWVMRGFFTHNESDDSEKAAMVVVRAVCQALLLDKNLHDETLYHGSTPPPALDLFELRMMGGVLCHYAQVSQRIAEFVAVKA